MVVLARGLGSPVQGCKNPWRRGGYYYRGRLASWIGNPANLSAAQKARTQALTAAAQGCKGTRGVKEGMSAIAVCVRKRLGGRA